MMTRGCEMEWRAMILIGSRIDGDRRVTLLESPPQSLMAGHPATRVDDLLSSQMFPRYQFLLFRPLSQPIIESITQISPLFLLGHLPLTPIPFPFGEH